MIASPTPRATLRVFRGGGWNNNLRGYDSGSFKCKYERGRVTDIDFSGLRGL